MTTYTNEIMKQVIRNLKRQEEIIADLTALYESQGAVLADGQLKAVRIRLTYLAEELEAMLPLPNLTDSEI